MAASVMVNVSIELEDMTRPTAQRHMHSIQEQLN